MRHPLTQICGVWENVSKRTGKTYFVGRLGDAKILVLENNDREEGSNQPTHNIVMQHAPREKASK